jgi:hypothetical protein
VLVLARDLFFRAKLEALANAAGARTVREEPADVAVVELADPVTVSRVAELTRQGIPVIAFASHVQAELLRAAREAGADALPNSRVESALREWFAGRR